MQRKSKNEEENILKKIKKRNIARFLAAMAMACAAFALCPEAEKDAYAASGPFIQVEQGQEFYIGDFFRVFKGDSYVPVSMVKASYSFSDPSVASVDGKGYFIAKGTGTATLTVTYQKQKQKEKIEVVPAGTFEVSEAAINLKARAEELAKNIPSSITAKNGFKLNKLKCDYEKANAGSISYISNAGLLQKKNTYPGALTKYIETEKLVVPQAGRFNVLDGMLSEFCDKNWPPAIKSVVSATSTNITAKLKKKFTAKHMLAMYISGGSGNDKLKPSSKKAYSSITIFDLDVHKTYYDAGSYKRYYGVIEYKKGSDKITIRPYAEKSKYLMYVKKGKKAKLPKGHNYTLTEYSGSYNSGKKFSL